MTHAVWFVAPLECLQCKTQNDANSTRLHTPQLTVETRDQLVEIGGIFEAEICDFEEAYYPVKKPQVDEDLLTLEQWTCSNCGKAQWAILRFHRVNSESYRFMQVTTVPLDDVTLNSVHFASRHLEYWIRDNPDPITRTIKIMLGLGELD